MTKKKKILVIIIASLITVLLIIGLIFVIKKTTEKIVTVVPVAEINWGYWGSDVNITGMVTSNAMVMSVSANTLAASVASMA